MGDRGGRFYRHPRRTADRGSEDYRRDPRDIEEIARLQQRIRDLELQQGGIHDEETDTDSFIRDEGVGRQNPFDHDDRWNPFARQQDRPDPLRNLGVKVDIPEFDGKAQPDEFIDWLHTVERIFELRDIPDRSSAMWRSPVMAKLVRQLGTIRAQTVLYSHSSIEQDRIPVERTVTAPGMNQYSGEAISKRQIGENVSRKDKISFLVKILKDLDNSKESVYNALDAWVAWEQDFPVGPLRRALIDLEKQHQWHRVIHVIKWMLSKGQGTTLGTYGQLVRALDMDHRAEEAHEVWVKKLGVDLHSVPWQLCHQMISVYYRNNMLERLVKLFKGLEAFDRKPRDKKIVKKVADAYEILGLIEEKERVLEKYKSLFDETSSSKKSSKTSVKK